jgi:integrase
MKMRDPHIVHLSTQSIDTLEKLHALNCSYDHIFPNRNNPKSYMSQNTMIYAVYRLGYHSRTTVHGFRATASTILNEYGFVPDVIERQLAHTERNKVRASYNHAQYLPERKKMMEWWGNYVDECYK